MAALNGPAAVVGRLPRCERCNGALTLTENEDRQQVFKCQACGHELPTSRQGSSPSLEGKGPVDRSEPAPDWQAEVRRRIAAAIARWQQADEARGEAQRLVAALVAYGAKDVPELPWKRAARASATSGPRQHKAGVWTCSKCGRTVTYRTGVELDGAGGYCCRRQDAPACETRQKARTASHAIP